MRVLFEKGKQREFLEYCINKLNIDWNKLADKININRGSFKNYKFNTRISFAKFLEICNLINEKPEELLNQYNGKLTSNGVLSPRKQLGESRTKLHKINITYNNSNYKLDISKIKFDNFDNKKNTKLPHKITPQLAEEIGIHLGDGFLSNKRNDYRLKGNKLDEKEYYDLFIKKLYKDLYNLNISLKEFDSVYGFEMDSQALTEFKNKVIGLPRGSKTQNKIRIPYILKINDIQILT